MNLNPVLKLINEVKSEAGENGFEFVDGTTKLRDLGLDSLDLAVLTVKIESEYGVDVFADGVVATVGEIAKKIDGR